MNEGLPVKAKELNVILMDCEQRSAEGIICSLGKHNLKVFGLSSRKRCPARYSKYISHYFQSPQLVHGFDRYLNFLVSLPFRGVIIPSGDLSVQFLSTHSSKLKEAGFLLNIVKNDVLLQAFDKWKCYELCLSQGVPVAKTALLDSEESVRQKTSDFNFPAIIKATRLAGGNYMRVFSDSETVDGFRIFNDIIYNEQFKIHGSNLILQEWVESQMEDNWSCEVFYDKYGSLRSALTIKRIRTSLNEKGTPTSRLYAGRIQENQKLIEITKKVLEAIAWQGIAHVEYIYDRSTQKFLLMEINPRLPGYSYLLSSAGYEFGYYYAADLLEMEYGTPLALPQTVYFEALRYPGDISDGIINSYRGYVHYKALINSYIRAFSSKNKIVIDYWNLDDICLSFGILLDNAIRFLSKVMRYIKRNLIL